MTTRPLMLAFAFVLTAVTSALAADTRFSQTLAISERAETGFNRLSSDQVAVLDALVRRDLAAQAAPRRNDPPPAARFSQRLTADERANAGLTQLTDKELTRLDALVDQHASTALARTLLAPPVFAPAGLPLRPTEAAPLSGVHGSISLSYGFGKGGYSEKTGAINLNYEDPVHGFSVMFGYAESQVKGPGPYRNGYIAAPPFVP
jgi:hypothetical protein